MNSSSIMDKTSDIDSLLPARRRRRALRLVEERENRRQTALHNMRSPSPYSRVDALLSGDLTPEEQVALADDTKTLDAFLSLSTLCIQRALQSSDLTEAAYEKLARHTLLRTQDGQIALFIFTSKFCPQSILINYAELTKQFDDFDRSRIESAVMNNECSPSSVHEKWFASGQHVYLSQVRHLAEEMQIALLDANADGNPHITRQIASHTKSDKVARRLMRHPDVIVRKYLAQNEHTKESHLRTLTQDSYATVRAAAYGNSATPIDAVAKASLNETGAATLTAAVLRLGNQNPELVARAANHASPTARGAAAAKTDDPELLFQLATDPIDGVRKDVRSNPASNDETLTLIYLQE